MMQSKFYSTCPLCKGRIKIGDWIDNKNELKKFAHVKCGENKSGSIVKDKGGKDISIKDALTAYDDQIENESESLQFNTDFTPSYLQIDIYNFIINGTGNAVVEGVAGCGKTSTIVQSLKYIPLALLVQHNLINRPWSYLDAVPAPLQEITNQILRDNKIAFLAYNKHIAAELKKRAPEYVHVSTLHSLGNSVVKRAFIGIKLDEDKTSTKLDEFWPVGKGVSKVDRTQNRLLRNHMRSIVSLIKNTLTNYRDEAEVKKMLDFYEVDIPDELISTLLEKVVTVMNRSKADTRTMDYDDMLWLPIVHNLQLEKFAFLLVDEGQDLNACQTEYVKRSLADKGRIILVGDRMQSLYGFRGADVYAIPRMIDELKATVLPLSISYRCPVSHVRLAQTLVSAITAKEDAIEGKVIDISNQDFLKEVDLKDMVICRTNAPLVKPAFECLRRGKKAIIRGQDIGRSLILFIEKFNADSLTQLSALMGQWISIEHEKFLNKGKELLADLLLDKFDTIQSVANECASVEELITKISILYSDNNTGVVFSTIHRAKGLEARRVFILRPDLLPHPKATQSWQVEQEKNAQYVAFTRSKEELYFVKKEVM